MTDDGILMPQAPERDWIHAELKSLIEMGGSAQFVLSPLWSPDPRDFPDPWTADEDSLRRLVRRLMRYAGACTTPRPGWEDADLELTLYRSEDIGGAVTPAGAGSSMWWVSRRGNTLRFAARIETLRDPLRIVPAAARAVAEAWRVWQGLRQEDDATLEQRRVDITTVYLGFGRLTTDASIRHGATRTDTFRLQRTTSRQGLLSPQALAFALATQIRVREQAHREIVRGMQANPAGFIVESLSRLPSAEALRATLNLGPPATWGTAPSLAELRAPLPSSPATTLSTTPAAALEDRGVLGRNEGRAVFRVERTKALRLARTFGLPVVLLGMLGTRMQMEVQFAYILPAAAALAVFGLLVGRWIPDARCSEPQCSTPLPKDASTCPRCKGTVVGVIRHPKERLAAEEAWLAEQGAGKPTPRSAVLGHQRLQPVAGQVEDFHGGTEGKSAVATKP